MVKKFYNDPELEIARQGKLALLKLLGLALAIGVMIVWINWYRA